MNSLIPSRMNCIVGVDAWLSSMVTATASVPVAGPPSALAGDTVFPHDEVGGAQPATGLPLGSSTLAYVRVRFSVARAGVSCAPTVVSVAASTAAAARTAEGVTPSAALRAS